MKIRSVVPENGCLIFWRTEKTKKNKKKQKQKKNKNKKHLQNIYASASYQKAVA